MVKGLDLFKIIKSNKKMMVIKKFLILAAGAGLAGLAGVSQAATNISLTPTTVDIKEGETFIMTINVQPDQGTLVYTGKVEFDFPEDLMTIIRFNHNPGWISLSQSGYDLIDNQNGKFIKTAGYPGGLNKTLPFGVVTFRAKKNGTGSIALGSGTQMLNANNQNDFSGITGKVAVAINRADEISAPIAAPEVTGTTVASETEEGTGGAVEETGMGEIAASEEIGVEEPGSPADEPQLEGLLAQVENFLTSIPGVITLALVLGGAYYAVTGKKNR